MLGCHSGDGASISQAICDLALLLRWIATATLYFFTRAARVNRGQRGESFSIIMYNRS